MNNEIIPEFDSNEELYFSWYLDELKANKLIIDYDHHPTPFILSERIDVKKEKLIRKKNILTDFNILREHIYTCDYIIYWNPDMKNILFSLTDNIVDNTIIAELSDLGYTSYVEIKPDYDLHNMTRLFKLNQKWTYDKYKIFVNLVIPAIIFESTFTPTKYLVTNKSSKDRKIKFKVRIITEFMKELKNKQLTLF